MSRSPELIRDRICADTAVLICTRNRPELLLKAVRAVMDGSRVPAELVIVDQSDTRNEAMQTLDGDPVTVRYIWSDARGASRARNQAVAAAQTAVLAFIDDDVVVDSHWLESLASALHECGPGTVVTGMVLAGDNGGILNFTPSVKSSPDETVFDTPSAGDVLYTGNMALFRSDFLSLGRFDERLGPGTRFPAAEDNDFGLRLLRHGYRIRYVPKAIVHHLAWRNTLGYFPLQWRYGLGQGAFYAKHVGDGTVRRRLLRDLVRPPLGFLRHFWKRGGLGRLFFWTGVGVGFLRWQKMYGRSANSVRSS